MKDHDPHNSTRTKFMNSSVLLEVGVVFAMAGERLDRSMRGLLGHWDGFDFLHLGAR